MRCPWTRYVFSPSPDIAIHLHNVPLQLADSCTNNAQMLRETGFGLSLPV